ncbi:MAG: LysE family translocator [Phaeospirillum sp.]|nr:LysE family translocator [Phaeospirillum sp.]
MMDPTTFVLAVLALLATPGPTNTLLAASGASVGVIRSLKLVPAEIGGYLTAITLLIAVIGPLVAAHAVIAVGLKLAASLWLICCALRLWRNVDEEIGRSETSIRHVFITTLVNPKALIFALVIFPQGTPIETAPWLAGFSGLVVIVAIGWICFGAALAHSIGRLATPRRIRRAAALGLTAFATVLAGAAIY